MAVKAIVVDDSNIHHLIVGLNRENVESMLRGDVFTLPRGAASVLSDDSDIVLMFEETDEALTKRFPPQLALTPDKLLTSNKPPKPRPIHRRRKSKT